MEIIISPNNFFKKDDLDRIFIYLDGNINENLIDYISNNIKNYQIEFIDKIVLFYSNKIKPLSKEQNNELINWKKEYIYQSDIFISFFNNSKNINKGENTKSYCDNLNSYIQYFYETYKDNISNHFLIGYKELSTDNLFLLKDKVKKASNNLLEPMKINDIKILGNLILQKIEKLYIETDYPKIPDKLKTIWPEPNIIDFNIGILGKYDTGKFSIWHWSFKRKYIRFFQGFGPGTDRIIYEVDIKNKKYVINFQFPAGQEKYDCLYFYNKFILKTNCLIFTFDITDNSSFEDMKNKYYTSVKQLDIKIKHFWILIGNKSDLRYKRKVSYEEANSFANEKNMKYFEISVKSGHNMEELFNYIHSNLINNNK